MVLYGIDASRHQGNVNWAAVDQTKDFMAIKATQGTSYGYVGWYLDNIAQARDTGLVTGAYHFLTTADGAAQARYFVDVTDGCKGELAVLDVETNSWNNAHPSSAVAHAFAAEFDRLVPGHPLPVYTGKWYWAGILGNPHGADIGPLWHSEYEVSQAEIEDGPESDNYGGWAGAAFWQYTSTGRCPGVGGDCDLDIFFGDRSDLARLTGQETDQGGLFMHLTEPEEREILTKVRELHEQRQLSWIAATVESRSRNVCYFVDGHGQSKIEMKIGGPLHESVKGLQALAGLATTARDVTEESLPPTVAP